HVMPPFAEVPCNGRGRECLPVGQFGDIIPCVTTTQGFPMATNTAAGAGQAHMDAYRTALRKRDFAAALRELVAAIQADPRQFAPFPVGKYPPQRIVRNESAG